jgi:hypothetical protein
MADRPVVRVPSWIERPLGRYYMYGMARPGRLARAADRRCNS